MLRGNSLLIGLILGILAATLLLLSVLTQRAHEANDGHDFRAESLPVALGPSRQQVAAVVGVQTGFSRPDATTQYNYDLRRQALRSTWFPASQQALDRYFQDTGLVLRFVIGHSNSQEQERALDAEAAEFGGFLRLSLQEGYSSLTDKTLEFLRTASRQYDARYIVKVDDDVFLRVDRLPHAFRQWDEIHADYIGCMKTGQIMKDARYRWHEPQHEVLGSATYFTHTWGSFYILSGRIAGVLATIQPGTLRYFANEDVTVGSWMLALNSTHMDDRRMCMPHCTPASIGVFDMPQCAGLCNPVESMPKLYTSPDCSDPAVHAGTPELPRIAPIFKFQRQKW
ncbi:hypothetical protein WJX73_007726 [Symbiochloris irregularis]|uniref:Hexosyltransferase n=1 Tax=Symbiochloris irregularis TaxID=706552 RepID=A0AAW1P3J1_9CHLO